MTAEEMIQVNNERRKQLNEENRKYYENMLVYLRLSSIPEKKTEELLLEMLDHLLIAQEERRRRKTYLARIRNPIAKKSCKQWANDRISGSVVLPSSLGSACILSFS
jgi:hypothetical protein